MFSYVAVAESNKNSGQRDQSICRHYLIASKREDLSVLPISSSRPTLTYLEFISCEVALKKNDGKCGIMYRVSWDRM